MRSISWFDEWAVMRETVPALEGFREQGGGAVPRSNFLPSRSTSLTAKVSLKRREELVEAAIFAWVGGVGRAGSRRELKRAEEEVDTLRWCWGGGRRGLRETNLVASSPCPRLFDSRPPSALRLSAQRQPIARPIHASSALYHGPPPSPAPPAPSLLLLLRPSLLPPLSPH